MPGSTANRKVPYPLPGDPMVSYPATAQQVAMMMEAEVLTDAKLATDGPSTYPVGTSVLTLYSGSASAGGWPDGAQASVLTVVRYTTPTVSQAWQIWNRSGQSVFTRIRSASSDVWGPWITLATDPGWTTFASSVTGVSRYRQIGSVGYIHVDGSVNTVTNTILNVSNAPLPASMWPSVAQMRTGAYFSGYPGTMTVDLAGNVTAIQSTGANRTSLSGILVYPLG